MIKLNDEKLPKNLKTGLKKLAEHGFVQLEKDGLTVTAAKGVVTDFHKTKERLEIVYQSERHFYMALAHSAGVEEGTGEIRGRLKRLGFMLDCSRNAVPKIDTVKRLICLLVMFGYSYLELYTEETYELPDEPYFGYKRGRYRVEELKEIISFAELFQMEIVPCIQTLGHLERLSRWKPYEEHMDNKEVLLVGDERTYALIRKSLKFCKEIFHTNRINIGTDEADLGLGKYLQIHGYQSKDKIYLEHLKRVFELCKEEGFYPEFWADALYHTTCSEEEIQSLFDGTQTAIYWDYYNDDAKFHGDKLELLQRYAKKVSYAGGVWRWIGYAPSNSYGEKILDAAYEAVEERQVDDILLTAWGDDGAECSNFAVIPNLCYLAEKCYDSDVQVERMLQELTGYSYQEWKMCDSLNKVAPEGVEILHNPAKYLLHNDYLLGLMDYNIPDNAGEIYERLFSVFQDYGKRKTSFSYIFQTYAMLAQALIRKSTYSKRLYKAYQIKDREMLQRLSEELEGIQADIKEFYHAFRNQWMTENKSVGFEVMDVRIGGMIMRADTVQQLLQEYLSGQTDCIYELEEEQLDCTCGKFSGNEKYAPEIIEWADAYTRNRIMGL